MTNRTAEAPEPAARPFAGVSGGPRRVVNRRGAHAGTTLRDAAILFACVLGTCVAALSVRQDANWDLQNYHFYDPWAWLTGRIFGPDIAAAQLQTFHNPLLDVPFYAMVRADLDPRFIACVLALPTAVAAFFLIKLCERLFRDLPRATGAWLIVAACAIGLSGAMGRSQFATTMNEWPGAMFTMAALYGLVRSGSLEAAGDLSRWTLVATGFLAGAASGLKLTAGTYALALAIALLLRRSPIRANVGELLMFCVGILAGLLATIGFWCWQLWNHYGNPLFPYANQWFRSPWWEVAPLLPRRFGPHALREALLFPFELYSPPTGFVAEVKYRDPRFPLLCLLAVVGAIVALSRRRVVRQASTMRLTNRREWTFLGVFFVAAFVIWAYVHSIARYLVPLELLAGALIVALIACRLSARHATSIVAVVAIVVIAMTKPGDWGRVRFGERWFVLKVPPVDDHALVLLASGAPMAYVLPFLPASTVNVGVATNLANPTLHNRLQDAIADRIAHHEGPLYSLAQPPQNPALALDFYGLEKRSCSTITTNMSILPLELCRLVRRRN
jgi:hypothetical protein